MSNVLEDIGYKGLSYFANTVSKVQNNDLEEWYKTEVQIPTEIFKKSEELFQILDETLKL